MSAHTERQDPQSLGLPRVGVETHAHLDYNWLDPGKIAQTIHRAGLAGVDRIVNVFLGLESYRAGAPILGAHAGVDFTLGIHPNDVKADSTGQVAEMAQFFAKDEKLKAVGEIGLDFYRDRSSPDLQRQLFREQLELALQLDKPVVIHSRQATAESLRLLDESKFPGERVLWHCFGEGPDVARELLARGYTLSVPGPVTYPKNDDLRRAVAEIDLGRLVLESDAPFLTPEPYRGKPNEPAFNVFTAACVAKVKNIPVEDVWRITGDNARAFFGLEPLE